MTAPPLTPRVTGPVRPVAAAEPGPAAERTRVAFVLRALPAYRIPLLRRLAAACPDFDVTVITGSESVAERGKLQTETSAQPFAIVPVPGRVWELWKYTVVWLHDCIGQLKAHGADVVIVEGNFGILSQTVVAAWARWTGRRVIFWVAGWQKPWVTGLAASLRHGFMRLVLPLGHHSVCYSTAAATTLRGLGVPAERVSVAQNTIDTEAIAAAAPAGRTAAKIIRRELGIGDRPAVVYVGALGIGKGTERLVELHAELRRRGHQVHTVIVGDGPGRAPLMARAAGVEGVHFLGRIVSGVDPYFAMGDVFVLPGLGGLAINQAMANGLPVLCTRADGTERDLVVDGVTGYFRDRYVLEEWADLVEGLINDPGRRRAMAEAGRERVLAVASLTKTARAFETAIRNRQPGRPSPAGRPATTSAAPISVLMSTYAGEQASFLEAALWSCAEQVTIPRQIVLVVDGVIGRDQDAVIEAFDQEASERGIEFTLVRLPEQGGLARAMNHGLPHCRWDYVARMDSDDISAGDRFALQWQVLRDRPEVDLVASWQADFESDPATVFRIKTVPELHGDILKVLRWRNAVSHPSIVFRKSLVRQIGGYRPIRYLEDYDLFMRLAGAGATYYGVQRSLIHVRVTDAQRFRRGGWRYGWDELRFRTGLYRAGSVSLANLLATGPAYFAFRLAPTWVKRSLYWWVRRGKKAGSDSTPPLGSDSIGTVGRAVAERAARAYWQVRGRSSNMAAGAVPVLCYHRIVPDPFQDRVPASSLAPDQFAAQLEFLKDEGFTALTLTEYGEMVRGNSAIPERPVLITFDDGYRDFATIAQPIAAAAGVRLNLFLCTGLPGAADPAIYERRSPELLDHQARYPWHWAGLTWDEVRDLRSRGVGLGFHSHRHESYGRLSLAGVTADVERGMRAWQDELGAMPTAFAFPKGGYGACPPSAVSVLRRAGFALLFSTRLGRTRLPSEEPVLDRIVIHLEDDLGVFRRKLFGAYDWLGGLRTAAQAARAVLGR